jgi:hypothetical protein
MPTPSAHVMHLQTMAGSKGVATCPTSYSHAGAPFPQKLSKNSIALEHGMDRMSAVGSYGRVTRLSSAMRRASQQVKSMTPLPGSTTVRGQAEPLGC